MTRGYFFSNFWPLPPFVHQTSVVVMPDRLLAEICPQTELPDGIIKFTLRSPPSQRCCGSCTLVGLVAHCSSAAQLRPACTCTRGGAVKGRQSIGPASAWLSPHRRLRGRAEHGRLFRNVPPGVTFRGRPRSGAASPPERNVGRRPGIRTCLGRTANSLPGSSSKQAMLAGRNKERHFLKIPRAH